jgi:hypothetical protein
VDLLGALIIALVVLWVLGIALFSSVGDIIHLLLVIAIIIIVVRLVQGQPVLG